MGYVKHFFRLLFNDYIEPYSKEWDTQLNQMLTKGTIQSVCPHTVTIIYKGVVYRVWINNKYFSYGYLWAVNGRFLRVEEFRRPKFRTMLRLEKLCEEWLEERSENY